MNNKPATNGHSQQSWQALPTADHDSTLDTPPPVTKETKSLVKMEEAATVREKQTDPEDRGTWVGKLDFVMSALSFAVGMGNIWRFPYLVYRNGGGAFLIPYLLMVALAGFPMMFLELAFGQYGSLGVVSIWKASPLFQGIGWTMFSISTISCIYYNMLVAYAFFYTFASLARDVPWRGCDNPWNTPGCGGDGLDTGAALLQNMTCAPSGNTSNMVNCTFLNGTAAHSMYKARSPADEYFHFQMLDISDGIEDLGGIKWKLALCLLASWVIVFVCLGKGIKSQGKVTYITSLFPYLVLFILLIRGLTLEGSADGIYYYLTPQWHRLTEAKVWGDAAMQVFYSMSISWGGLITLASYNKFNNNCLRDSIIVAAGDCLTSIFAGVVIFAIIGYMAHELGVPIDKVATQGAGLAYIVYPSAVTRLPISPLWAVLFMVMILNLGFGTQMTLVTTAHTTLLDVFHTTLRKGKRPVILLAVLCTLGYLLGLIMATRGGMYVLQIMDSYAPSYGLLIVGLSECLVISYVYGYKRFYKDLEQMLGSKPGMFWFVCWGFITPALIVFILGFTLLDFKRSSYGDYTYPVYADVVGAMITLTEILFIPGVAIYKIATVPDPTMPLVERIKFLMKPADDWGPLKERQRQAEMELSTPLKTVILS